MIAVIDYGMGNLRSVQKGFERVGHKCIVTRDTKEISNATHVVLPGVGAFKDCMENLKNYGLVDSIIKAIQAGKPFLGICLGLQLLFSESEEFGRHEGLDIIKGQVVRFPSELRTHDMKLKIPHIGWNNIKIDKKPPILKDIAEGSYLYFVHSYYVVPKDSSIAATSTYYGIDFVSSIWKDNIFACQFHPEKSQDAGLKILKNFGNIKD